MGVLSMQCCRMRNYYYSMPSLLSDVNWQVMDLKPDEFMLS